MTRILIFGKAECAKCKTTKHKVSHLITGEAAHQVEMVFHDQDTIDGRAEGAFYDLDPSRIPLTVVEQEDRQVARWDGDVPDSQDVHRVIVGV